MIKIISAGIQNADAISELATSTFYETYAIFNTKADMELYTRQHYNTSKITEEMKEPEIRYFMASYNDVPAGFAKMRNTEQPELLVNTRNIEIERIYVLRRFQKLKIGKELIEHCINSAAGLSFEVIWLGVWQQNLKALNFYEKNGFEKFGTHSFLLGEDLQTDWLMKRKL
jgi:ribosomal protein S18 acetylase RimI-like enzyme